MRQWRPYITAHAIARFLERVVGVPVIGALRPGGAGHALKMLRRAKMRKAEVLDGMWPEHMRLDADPGGCFAMKRGDVRFIVRDGVMLTVSIGTWRPSTVEKVPQIS